MPDTKHSPLPWSVVEHGWSDTGIYGNDNSRIAHLTVEDEWETDRMDANSALIVRAVNNHQTLVDACLAAIQFLDLANDDPTGKTYQVYKKLRDAIHKAKGGLR